MNKYKIVRAVRIRKGAEIVENIKGSNREGQYQVGDIVEVYDTQTDGNRRTWGRVSEPDPTGKANYFCIKELNGVYAELVDGRTIDSWETMIGRRILVLEERVAKLESR